MIEVVYKEEKQEAKNGENLFQLPRNIRQIGLAGGNFRIYIEDYVYTFLGRLAGTENGTQKGCVAILTGETKWDDGITYLFVRGALMVEDMEAAADHIDFSEKIWAKIQAEQEKFFPGQEITGWFFSRPQMYLNVDELFTKVHLRYFGGEKVLMLMEPIEREDAFFCYENGFLAKQRGYYIYYEKNPLMQEYMIEKNKDLIPEITEKVEDEAVTSFRRIIRNKKTKKAEEVPKEEPEPTHASVFSYAATACLVLAVLAVGAGFYRNYRKIMEPVPDATVTVLSEDAVSTENEKTNGNGSDSGNFGMEIYQESTGNSVDAADSSYTDAQNGEFSRISEENEDQEEEEKQEDEKQEDETGTGMETVSGGENADIQENDAGSSVTDETEGTDENTESTSTKAETYLEEADERKLKKSASASLTDAQNTTSLQETSGTAHETYIIKPGDTLYQISISHYGNMDAIPEICRLNGLKENQVIYPGQMIVLP